ncbi:IS4 family transposase [Dysgonomonas sp. 521]|uniref:IS4 family transposase n=1 Tax=Dysgonomonas sp. 521 TaxID=2302932 RepID=UPI0013D328F3|nr:IS4 family transposase [Dysgonomonas sp. 521]NDV96933.1 IS4 family transposase [Dysgonomonas sp. 521]
MSKSRDFIGQPILNQLLIFIQGVNISKIAKKHDGEYYVKKFDTRKHLIVMLFGIIEGYHSIRELVIGMLSNAHKLSHLGLDYMVRRSTLSDANARRKSAIFGDIYMEVYRKHSTSLSDSRLTGIDVKRLYAMDSTTISLFKDILKGCGRLSKEGKKKGGIKAHTIIDLSYNMPCLVRYTQAVRHDHVLLSEVHLEKGSFITFDKGYVDYAQYERFTREGVFYVTRLKDNARYDAGEEFDIPESSDSGVLKDEEIILHYGENGKLVHPSRRIAYWDAQNGQLFEFITNNLKLPAEKVALIYKKRWQIELLFKQLKQNFPLKYFLGDNQNAIEIQIWISMLANLLIALVRSKVKRPWAFSNMVSVIRQQLMSYINIYSFLEDPEGSWRCIINKQKMKYQNSLFPEIQGAYF